MKKYKFLFLVAFVMIFGIIMAISASAEWIETDGVRLSYTLTDNGDGTGTAILNSGNYVNGFKGERLIIPESFEYKDVVYTVTEIGTNAFNQNSTIKYVLIPRTVKVIEVNAFWCVDAGEPFVVEFDETNGPSQLETVCGQAFYKSAVGEIRFPKSLKEFLNSDKNGGNTGSNQGIFRECLYPVKISFEDGCPNVTTLPMNFLNGTVVEEIVVPRNCQRIEAHALNKANVVTIPISSIVFTQNTAFSSSPIIRYPGTEDDYKAYIAPRVDHKDYQNYFQQAYNNRNNGKFIFVTCVPEYDIHELGDDITVKYPNGFDKYGYKAKVCSVCNNDVIEETLAPIFFAKGYSVSEVADENGNFAIMGGYEICLISLDAYVKENGTLDYGIIFVNANNVGTIGFKNGVIDLKKDTNGKATVKAVQVQVLNEKEDPESTEETRFNVFNYKVSGFSTESEVHKSLKMLIAMYVIDNGDMSFIQSDSEIYENVTVGVENNEKVALKLITFGNLLAAK